MRRWEPPRSKGDGQTKLEVRRHHQDLASKWILIHLKITVPLCHTQDRLLHGFGRILIILRLLDYNMMHMQPYGIQYRISYSKYSSSQWPITANGDLAKIGACAKQCENNGKQGSRYTQAEVVSLRLISHQKEEVATNAQERVYGTTSGGCTSKVGDHEAGMEA
jgi:hypothetical protein